MSDSWDTAIETLGIDQALDLSRDVTTQWQICVITSKEGRPTLTQEEEIQLFEGWSFKDQVDEVRSLEESKSSLVVAKMRGDGILANWREQREKLLDKKKYFQAKNLKPNDRTKIRC